MNDSSFKKTLQKMKRTNIDCTFSNNIKENKSNIEKLLGTSQDVMLTEFKIQLTNGGYVDALLVAIDGLVDEEAKRNNVLNALIETPLNVDSKKDINLDLIGSKLAVKSAQVETNIEKAIDHLLKAQALLMIDTISEGLIIAIEGFEIRSIDEPETEQSVRGSREGFIETTSVNLSLIRRRIMHPSLRFETIEVGKYSQTGITMAYVKDIVDPKIVQLVKKRLKEIEIDNIISSGEVEQLIEDHPYSIFPTVGNTSRPDYTAALLMEGRVSIFVDGDPVSLYVPYIFVESIKNVEDYSSRPYYTSFIRLIRFLAFIVSISLPALFISAVNFNKSLIPSDLLVTLIVARESVPFSLALEMSIMIVMFEIVREAGVRLPKQIGTAVSIVGPLILGEVAVSSSLVGAPTVIIVSISYISAFVISAIADVTALVRIGLFISASIFGSYGFVVALLAILTHMVSLTSFTVPYMSPFSPVYISDWKDTIVRFPTRLIKKRQQSIPTKREEKLMSVPKLDEKK